nr:MAG TPA_asm: hypothetical protein [Bacteriophage sp.]
MSLLHNTVIVKIEYTCQTTENAVKVPLHRISAGLICPHQFATSLSLWLALGVGGEGTPVTFWPISCCGPSAPQGSVPHGWRHGTTARHHERSSC